MLTEYCGNVKVGSMYAFLGVEGWIIYVADGDGNYNGIGNPDTNIWLQKVDFGGCENEDDKLFIKGVEFFDKYADGDMWDKCSNALYWLSDNKIKSSQLYCNILGFFLDLGKWDGTTDPKEYLAKLYNRVAKNRARLAFNYDGNEPFEMGDYVASQTLNECFVGGRHTYPLSIDLMTPDGTLQNSIVVHNAAEHAKAARLLKMFGGVQVA